MNTRERETDMDSFTYKNRSIVIFEAFVLMIMLQGIAELTEWYISPLFPGTRLYEKIINSDFAHKK